MIDKREVTDVKCDMISCSPEHHASLVSEIMNRMKRIRDAQSIQSTDEEVESVPLVRVDGGVSVG